MHASRINPGCHLAFVCPRAHNASVLLYAFSLETLPVANFATSVMHQVVVKVVPHTRRWTTAARRWAIVTAGFMQHSIICSPTGHLSFTVYVNLCLGLTNWPSNYHGGISELSFTFSNYDCIS